MADSPAVTRLRATFAALARKSVPLSAEDYSALEDCVLAVVNEMRKTEARPERVVDGIKGLALKSGIDQRDCERLLAEVIHGCLRRYHGC